LNAEDFPSCLAFHSIPHPNPNQEEAVADKVPVIDEEACIGCGACEEMCPEVFKMNESLGFALVVNPGGADVDKIAEAMEACPVNCITWSED
jgi:ferredoxin